MQTGGCLRERMSCQLNLVRYRVTVDPEVGSFPTGQPRSAGALRPRPPGALLPRQARLGLPMDEA